MKTLLRHTLSLALLGGLVGTLGAFVLLPGLEVRAESIAAVLGAIALYALGVLMLFEHRRVGAAARRQARGRIRSRRRQLVVLPPAPIGVSETARERLAA